MQIHELNEGFGDLIKGATGKISKAAQSVGDKVSSSATRSNVARGSAQQQKINQQAATYAERLKQQGFQPTQSPAATPQPVQQPIQIGGQMIQPSDPNYAKIVASLGQQAGTQPSTPTASATPVAQKPVVAGPVRTKQAGPVYTGQATAIMTSPEFRDTLMQLGMNTQHIEKLAQTVQANPAFATTLLKQLGLKK